MDIRTKTIAVENGVRRYSFDKEDLEKVLASDETTVGILDEDGKLVSAVSVAALRRISGGLH